MLRSEKGRVYVLRGLHFDDSKMETILLGGREVKTASFSSLGWEMTALIGHALRWCH